MAFPVYVTKYQHQARFDDSHDPKQNDHHAALQYHPPIHYQFLVAVIASSIAAKKQSFHYYRNNVHAQNVLLGSHHLAAVNAHHQQDSH